MDVMMKRIYQFIIIGGVAVLVLILSLATPVVLSSSDFSVFNPGWNGCSAIGVQAYKSGKMQPTFFIDQNELTVNQQSFVEYSLDAESSVIVLIGPQEPCSDEELVYLTRFLADGGRVFLADDFGTGNQILEGVNASSRFSNRLLLDLSFEKNASFVQIFDFPESNNNIINNVSSVLLNYPSSIQPAGEVSILARSSPLSWLDGIENGVYDVSEAQGPFPILVIEQIGLGEVVICSTPSVFINSMNGFADNKVFRENLFSYLFERRSTVVFDESHRAVSGPLQVSYFFPSVIGWQIKIAIVLLVVGLFIAWFTPVPRYLLVWVERLVIRTGEDQEILSTDQVVEELLQRHPTWNRKKLTELVKRMDRL